MQHRSDAELLRRYAREGSEAAFGEIVARHAALVYSTALRQLHCAEAARDVAQSVFIDLSRKARKLANKLGLETSLAGWLYRSTCFAASSVIRQDLRRRAREKKVMQHLEPVTTTSSDTPEWRHLRPLLDDAMSCLRATDRDALLLRFFENKDLRAVGVALGISNDAAQKRVARALEQLRKILARHGFTTTSAALSITISTNAVQTVPIDLVTFLSSAGIVSVPAIKGSAILTANKIITMTMMQKTALAAALAIAAGTGIYQSWQKSRLSEQVELLQQHQTAIAGELAQAKSQNEILSNEIQSSQTPFKNTERLGELLHLRGEVGVLRRRQRELEQALASGQSQSPGQATHSSGAEYTNSPRPFQVRLVSENPAENTEIMTNSASRAEEETIQVQNSPLLDYTAIRSTTVTKDPSSGAPEIDVEFSEEGKDLFAAITRENINKRLAIVLDGQVLSAPVIRSEIAGGKAQITGNFTEEEANVLAAKINDAIRSQ